jgi:hypothetical protein
VSFFQYPWDTDPAPVVPPSPPDPDPDSPKPKAKRRGRRPASVTRATSRATGAASDWLYHHLTVSGPAEIVENFAAAARGSGVTPWQLDFAALEEDIFVRAVAQPASQRNLTVEGCRILARQFRERVEMRQARAASQISTQGKACARAPISASTSLTDWNMPCPFSGQAMAPSVARDRASRRTLQYPGRSLCLRLGCETHLGSFELSQHPL